MTNPSKEEREKPCHRCEGVEMTWRNRNDFHICDKHMAEIFAVFSDTFERNEHHKGSST